MRLRSTEVDEPTRWDTLFFVLILAAVALTAQQPRLRDPQPANPGTATTTDLPRTHPQ